MGKLATLIRKLRTRIKVKTDKAGNIVTDKHGSPVREKILPRLLSVFERKPPLVGPGLAPQPEEALRQERSERRKLRRRAAARYATLRQTLAHKELWTTIRERARIARKLGR